VEAWLSANPAMQARSALEELQRRYPGRFEDGQQRSLQRRFKQWRLDHGVAVKAIYFAQEHLPGRLLQLDWFHPRDFAVTISGEAYRHLLCHCVLSFSNWEWVSVCHSESFSSLKTALQGALWELGGVPSLCQVDNSSTATHRLSKQGQRRGFNERFLGLLAHYGMQPKTIQVGQANENGDVESAHRHLRSYLVDTLALRGNADFESVEAYEAWLRDQVARRNASRALKLAQERELFAALPPVRLPEYEELPCQVNKYGLVRVGKGSYSVPAKYRGQSLRARVFERGIELWHQGQCIARFEQSANASGAAIDWRHLIEDLCRKPGAFERYRYRDFFYPSEPWRRASDALRARFRSVRADSDYLQILRLSLEHGMERIEKLLQNLLEVNDLSLDRVRHELGHQAQWRERALDLAPIDLSSYDRLLSEPPEAASEAAPEAVLREGEVEHG